MIHENVTMKPVTVHANNRKELINPRGEEMFSPKEDFREPLFLWVFGVSITVPVCVCFA